jgi:hypothetical protein
MDKKCDTRRKIIVSLTSFPPRIQDLWMVIESLIRQETKPDLIILYLSKEQFSDIPNFPQKLLAQCSRGLVIKWVDGDIRSHKKYFYSFREYPNDFVILVDDDIVYPSTMITELLRDMKPGQVRCSYAKRINYDDKGNYRTYNSWKYELGKSSKSNLFFGSGGGTAFIPSELYQDVLNDTLFMSLTPTADDIWLNAMVRLSNLCIEKVRTGSIFPLYRRSKGALHHENLGEGMNDLQLRKVSEYYKKSLAVDPFSRDLHLKSNKR